MHQYTELKRATSALILAYAAFAAGNAIAAETIKEQIVGTWQMV
jgi:hypothetical protein